MPDQLTTLLTQRDAAPCARVLAALHLVLGRPARLAESGLSRASYYRHRSDAERMIRAHFEKNQGSTPVINLSTGDHIETVIHRPAKLSTESSTGSARLAVSSNQELAAHGPRKTELSTARRRRVNTKSHEGAAGSASLIQGDEAKALNALRERHAAAARSVPHLPRLVLDPAALMSLRSALAASGLEYVLGVAEQALQDACAGRIPSAWYARMWHGAGYDARASAYDEAQREKSTKAHDRSALCEATIATLKACGVEIR